MKLKISLKKYSIRFINFYQKNLSILKKPSCVFYPTCSEYTKQAIEKYGVLKGLKMGFLRILRCHPWHQTSFDHIDLP